jgi:hypothetical protein
MKPQAVAARTSAVMRRPRIANPFIQSSLRSTTRDSFHPAQTSANRNTAAMILIPSNPYLGGQTVRKATTGKNKSAGIDAARKPCHNWCFLSV